ncbi:MAG: hypothetical protein LUE98_15605 [Tannerellaceae bacterium]|nr:hypothetical protein [Tannerellaceae bacterium]
MLKRDFIMVMIEELGKAVAQMITNRNHGATRKNESLVQVAYSTLKVDTHFLLKSSPEEMREYLDKEDGTVLQRMELAAKVLLEESYLYPEQQQEMRQKVKDILEYIQKHDTTFSLERVNMINELIQAPSTPPKGGAMRL